MALQTKIINANGSNGHHKFALTLMENSTEIATNKSSMSFVFQLDPIQAGWDWNWSGQPDKISYSINIDGQIFSGTIPVYSGSGTIVIRSEALDIVHNNNGNKSIAFSFSVSDTTGANYTCGSASSSDSMTLTFIPRVSKITCPSFNIGDSTIVNIERYSSSFRDTITWEFGNLSGTLATKTSNTSIGFTPNASNFYAQIPNAKSGTGTIICQTYLNDTLIGTSQCNFTAYTVEASPDVSVDVVDTNEETITLTGDSSKIIKFMSKPKFTINATAKNSATIKSYLLLIEDGQRSETKETTFNNGIGIKTYTAQATDSRGYKGTKIGTISNFVDYVKCSFTKKDIFRLESASQEIKVDLAGNYYNGSFGATNNSINLKYRTREQGGTWSEYTEVEPILNGNSFSFLASLGMAFSIELQYDVEFVLSDKLTNATLSYTVNKGIGIVEIGEDFVDINGSSKILDMLTVGDIKAKNIWANEQNLVANRNSIRELVKPIEEGTYTISWDKMETNSTQTPYLRFQNDADEYVGAAYLPLDKNFITVKLSSTATKFRFYPSNTYANSEGISTTIYNTQMETGTVATKYFPHKSFGIVESGSNENGEWVKFDNRIMMCFATITHESIDCSIQYGNLWHGTSFWRYPQPFIEEPIYVNGIFNWGGVGGVSINNLTNEYVNFYPYNAKQYTGTNRKIKYFAIGYWK